MKDEQILEGTNVDVKVSLLSELYTNDDWLCDKWLISFVHRHTGASVSFEYHTGTGHRIGLRNTRLLRKGQRPADHKVIEARRVVQQLNCCEYLTVPNAADAIYCILMDRTHGESFEEWCGNFGYDPDSRKALDIYLTCQKQEDQALKVFGTQAMEKFETLLEDY